MDRAIVLEEKRVVVIRFGSDADPTCMRMDEVLASIADDCKAFASVFLVDLGEVPDFTEMCVFGAAGPPTDPATVRTPPLAYSLARAHSPLFRPAPSLSQVRAVRAVHHVLLPQQAHHG